MDVMRTFPDDTMIQSEQGQQSLTRILHALMTIYPAMGYAQHSAFVAGMVLIVMGWEREEDAFWILVQLFEKAKGIHPPQSPSIFSLHIHPPRFPPHLPSLTN
jgi:Rab-GTPase-TBC domain